MQSAVKENSFHYMRTLSETVSESCQRGAHVKTVLIEHWSIELRYCCCFTGLEWVKTHLYVSKCQSLQVSSNTVIQVLSESKQLRKNTCATVYYI